MAYAPSTADPLVDAHGRTIRYLRISVTDRCDLRCRYCMPERVTFLPRAELLGLEEIAVIAERFIARGVSRIRLTGGEPLVRGDVGDLIRRLGRHVGQGLDELTLTTNGVRLADHAEALVAAGVRRVNVSLDSLDPDVFRHVTRHGDLARVLGGIFAARDAGLAVKINTVALRGVNDRELPDLLAWAAGNGFDLSLIETMPLGEVGEDRADRFLSVTEAFATLSRRFALTRDVRRTAGPSRYWLIDGGPTRLGLISPLTADFCDGCDRVRLTTDGKLYLCLGHDDRVDLKAALRGGGVVGLDEAIDRGLSRKPARHVFDLAAPAVARHMSATGG